MARSLLPEILSSLIVVAAIGCGQDKRSDSPREPAPEQTPEEAGTDPALAAEYESLPQIVMVGVSVDEDGRDVPTTAEMRVPADANLTIDSEEAAGTAYEQGAKAKVVRSADELDADTSTQSWTGFDAKTDYASYRPAAYSKSQAGQTYAYSAGTRYQTGDKAIYVYRRPTCRPPYCRPIPEDGEDGGDDSESGSNVDKDLKAAMAKFGVKSLGNDEWYRGTPEQIELGARLFNDKLLSAKNDVACASCHMDYLGTGSADSLGPTGEVLGGRKRGNFVVTDLLGRNAPPLYNLGHKSMTTMFWDGRIATSTREASGFESPAGDSLPLGLANALAAQALFPLIAGNEMGCGASAMVAVIRANPTQSWTDIMTRVLKRRDYKAMFQAAFPGERNLGIAHLANAIAAYEADRWRADNSPFDRYLRGDMQALSNRQKVGATYFYGKARCAGCHSGALQTDHGYHAIAIPQWGPGAGDGSGGQGDHGRGRITGKAGDRYKFRTPTLRNVAVTGPWGHTGAYRSLRGFVAHYVNPRTAHDKWNPAQAVLPAGFAPSTALLGAWNDAATRTVVRNASEIDGIPLTREEIDQILEFLLALTDGRVAQSEHVLVVDP